MIITESFIWINYPKTASTFVRESLRQLYALQGRGGLGRFLRRRRWMKEMRCPDIRAGNFVERGQSSPHGLLRQVPSEYLGRPVVSAVRDPVERLVSLYNYGHWRRPHVVTGPLQQIREVFPLFPDISFEEFLFYRRQFGSATRLIVDDQETTLGLQSFDLLRFFCDEQHFLDSAAYFRSWQELAQIIGKIRFLRTDSINEDLCCFLVECGFNQDEVDFIRSKPKANVSTHEALEIPTAEARLIYQQEWLLAVLNGPRTAVNADLLQSASESVKI